MYGEEYIPYKWHLVVSIFVKLPNYKSFPIFVAYNCNEDDEFLIYTYKNGMIDEENSINILAFSSYNDIKEDFAIFYGWYNLCANCRG